MSPRNLLWLFNLREYIFEWIHIWVNTHLSEYIFEWIYIWVNTHLSEYIFETVTELIMTNLFVWICIEMELHIINILLYLGE